MHHSLTMRLKAAALFLLLPIVSHAQDFRRGFIIKNNKDSLSGYIIYGAEKKNTSQCVFRESKRSGKVVYSPNDLISYGFYEDKKYVSMQVPLSKEKVFVKELVKGPLTLYGYKNYFLAKKDSLILLPLPKSKTVETSSGTKSRTDNRYIGIMNFLVSDCKMSADEIKYSEGDLTNLVTNYNRCQGVDPGFKKLKPLAKVNFHGFGGYMQSKMDLQVYDPLTSIYVDVASNPSNTVFGGVGIEYSAPRIFDKLFFTLEFQYAKNVYQGAATIVLYNGTIIRDYILDFTYIKTPLGLRYNFLKDSNTPYIKGGLLLSFMIDSKIKITDEREDTHNVVVTTTNQQALDIHKQPKGIWFSAGYNWKILKNFQLFSEVRYDRGEGFIGTASQSSSSIQSYSVLLGLRF